MNECRRRAKSVCKKFVMLSPRWSCRHSALQRRNSPPHTHLVSRPWPVTYMHTVIRIREPTRSRLSKDRLHNCSFHNGECRQISCHCRPTIPHSLPCSPSRRPFRNAASASDMSYYKMTNRVARIYSSKISTFQNMREASCIPYYRRYGIV